MADVDLQEQISDLKSLLRTTADALERHLRAAEEDERADHLKKAHMRHHEYRTERQTRQCRLARGVINKASDYEGGPHLEDLEKASGRRLPGAPSPHVQDGI